MNIEDAIATIKIAASKFENLSPKCRKIAELIGERYAPKQIASLLGKSFETVHSQIRVCKESMGVLTTSQLAIAMYWRELSEAKNLTPPTRPIAEIVTPRELEIAYYIVDGYSDLNIAANLEITEETVGRHITNLSAALGVSNRTAIARRVLYEEFCNRNLSPVPQ